ncbi:MAG: hypothetical protein LC676_19175 [Loktanella sp.]|nr:hypothetical protein [Loktanella sp.]
MQLSNLKTRIRTMTALVCLPLVAGAAFAQDTDGTDGMEMSEGAIEQSDTGALQDAVVVTVGDAEIVGADVMTVINMMPQEMQSQPSETLVPMAIEQLILRELIVAEARSEDLSEDPDVIALVEGDAQAPEEDAMVQVWLDRELSDVVTDEAVQDLYDEAAEQQDLPPLEEARPQIEQALIQQAIQDIRNDLEEDVEVVFYDESGEPLEQAEE